jgi:hypothetical protein
VVDLFVPQQRDENRDRRRIRSRAVDAVRLKRTRSLESSQWTRASSLAGRF